MKEETKLLAVQALKDQAARAPLEFFHDPEDEAYAAVPCDDHVEVWKIGSKRFRLWVTKAFYDRGLTAKALVKSCLEEFEMHAICRGPCVDVFVRLAENHGAVYIDLADPRWQVVEITSVGWTILNRSPVKFRRPKGMESLPTPQRSGKLRDVLRFLNICPQSEILLLVWLSYCFRPGMPYPILVLPGVQGSGKSTITRVLRALIDPSLAALTTTPRSERDLAISASNHHLICLDNLSAISAELSDALCRVSTGGSFRTRKLYTDSDETILTYRRPLVINGIEELPQRPDLLDRAILINVEPIPEDCRQDERTLWKDFEKVRAKLFGGLLDVLATGMRLIDGVQLPSTPRMADFARWGTAVEEALGFQPGDFMAAYSANLDDANAAALEASPIAQVIYDFLADRPTHSPGRVGAPRQRFHGTAFILLQDLVHFIEYHQYNFSDPTGKNQYLVTKHPRWPKSASALSAEVARVEPNLETWGVRIGRGRNHYGRFIDLALPAEDSPPKRHLLPLRLWSS